MLVTTLFTKTNSGKQPKCPLGEGWMRKMRYTHINTMESYLMIKQNEVMLFAPTCMDLEIIILVEVCQREKDKHQMILILCGIYNHITN